MSIEMLVKVFSNHFINNNLQLPNNFLNNILHFFLITNQITKKKKLSLFE